MCASGIHLAETVLPEPAADGQKRVVFDDDVLVFLALADARSLKLTGNLARVGVEHLGNLVLGGLALAQKDFARNGFDIRIGKLNANGEAIEQLAQQFDK